MMETRDGERRTLEPRMVAYVMEARRQSYIRGDHFFTERSSTTRWIQFVFWKLAELAMPVCGLGQQKPCEKD